MKINYIIIKNILLLSIICMLLSGCGLSILSNRASNPVIREWAFQLPNTAEIYATKASHRMFFTQTKENLITETDKNGNTTGIYRQIITCAEPSPDVAEAVAEATANAFKLSLKEPNSGANVDAQNQYTHTLATEIAPLLYRTQGLQLYRNAASDLCIDFMNGVIDRTTYTKEKNERFRISASLIATELEKIDKTTDSFFKHFKTSGPQLSISDIAKLANAFEGKEPKDSDESEDNQKTPPTATPPTPTKIDSLKPLVVIPANEKITETNSTGTIKFTVQKMNDTTVTFAVAEGGDLSTADSNGAPLTVKDKNIVISKNIPVTLTLTNLIKNRDVTITVSGSPSGQKEVFKFPVVSDAQ